MWPPPIYQPKSNEELDELGVRFGLVDRVNGKLEFLHRTYAEYLMAEYLFQGFQLEDDKHNGLLDNEPIRKLIANEILIKDQYNGVRIFLDSMLKDVFKTEEWKREINENYRTAAFPERLTQFVENVLPLGYSRAIEKRHSNIHLLIRLPPGIVEQN